MITTFKTSLIASLQSVGTASTLAFAGVYLHRRGFVIGPDSKKTMALLCHQVTIPLILFTNLVKCTPEKYNPDQCFTATDQLRSGLWILLIWPIYVMSIGVLIGVIVSTLLTTTTDDERKVVIILMTDPSTVLAVYLIIDNTIKFVVGGLLFPRYDKDHHNEEDDEPQQQLHNSKNKFKIVLMSFCQPPVIASVAGFIVLSIPQLRGIFVNLNPEENHHNAPLEWLFNGMASIGSSTVPITMTILGINLSNAANNFHVKFPASIQNCIHHLRRRDDDGGSRNGSGNGRSATSSSNSNDDDNLGLPTTITTLENNNGSVGSNIDHGINTIGSINEDKMSRRTVILTVLGKMLLMPIIGILSVCGLQQFVTLPPDIASSMYFVMMLVFIVPKGTNIVVLVELSSGY